MIDFLLQHASRDPVSFHMPGHKGQEIFRRYGYGDFLDRFVDCDVTEIPGADSLFQAEGIIKDIQDRYADLYDVDHSYLMINGTSGGILAAMMASVPAGGKIIMARNCHKSVFNGLVLGRITPVYAYPSLLEDCGVMGPIPPGEIERLLDENPDACAVILPSPNYYGVCSDIRTIAEIVHARGKILIVDQAHGAHLHFFHKFGCGEGLPESAEMAGAGDLPESAEMAGAGDLPESAEMAGADITICSIHKTLASLTQSAVLNLNSERVDRYELEDRIQAVESTSPSYILMSFLDINARILKEHGPEVFAQWKANLDHFYAKAGGIAGLSLPDMGPRMDRTKINLDMSAYGINGAQLEELLMERAIFPELYTGNILMLMTGIGNTRRDMDRTIAALEEIAAAHELTGRVPESGQNETAGPEFAEEEIGGQESAGNGPADRETAGPGDLIGRAPASLHPVPGTRIFVDLAKSEGRVCAGSIIPYPPGIPIVCPGEEITADVIRLCQTFRDRGEKVIGINDQGKVLVGAE